MAILTVSQLNKYVNYYLKENKALKNVYLRGEIVNLKKYYASGHYYFSLKDENSIIKVCMFSSYASNLKFDISDGMSVIIMGDVGLYEKDGAFQLYAYDIYPSGTGEEYLKYCKLKGKLKSKGYFDSKNKKTIPIFPKKVAIVTSAESAAIQDIINILSRRNPLCRIDVFSTLVQGEKAEKNICEKLLQADDSDADTIIIARGGGSAEDLSIFNSEKICDIIFSLNKPVISAIGHETDYTLSDYTSDMRAPTPSAAAELCSIPLKNIKDICDSYMARNLILIKNKINSIENALEIEKNKLHILYSNKRYSNIIIRNNLLTTRINKKMTQIISEYETKNNILYEKLESNSVGNVMKKGYCMILKNGTVILPEESINIDDKLEIIMQNKRLIVKVMEVNN